MLKLEGFYQHPGRAAREAARLSLNDGYLTITLESSQRIVPWQDVKVSDALGTIPLTLTFADGARFVPNDDAVFRQWWQQRHRPSLIHRIERKKRFIPVILLAALAGIAFYVLVIVPMLCSQLARHMPFTLQQRIGQQTLIMLQQGGFRQTALTPAQLQHTQALFEAVIPPEMRSDPLPIQLKIMHTPDGPNAFMLADGTLILSDQLVTLAKSDDALAAVMLHEIGHHYYRHSMNILVRSSLLSLSYLWFTGDASGIADIMLQSALVMHQLQFTRDMEREADHYAIKEMKAQQRSLSAMAEIFRQLDEAATKREADEMLPGWLSTHPDMPQRIKDIQAAG
ncbi:MAG: Beta-barrel assembly-enhancing protease [Candidatus Erwinia impunctatus]|nr:Beta-barrel assembly-enhancing protease [Culicoides impunctatus]